ncbi:glycosyl transferase [Catellatospora sp. TT07R-123]|uniref:glycosyltransferase family 2 protein n=1 Tax=Catellatospora sp. TT07R-123 TaxID=2733863 RepID=UPI001B19F61D|nr:glycosyltransferase family 2 protein [Catellatospora sp. TT07R-123]GHJ46415.1 glycosyl transferase [Catellatospora sp. TT07R-123]
MTAKVSVVVPTRNRPELLAKALDAILGQEYPGPIEVIVVFDQSEPDLSLRRDDPHREVRVITNARTQGLAGGRNTGIGAATGELVAFCDDDDEWLPGKLAAQVALLDARPESELCCIGVVIDYDGRDVERTLGKDSITLPDLLRDRLTELHPSTFLFRRAALVDGIGLVDENIPGSYAEDYELLLRAARRAPIANAPGALVRVRWHRQSYFTARWATIAEALQWLLERYPEFDSAPRGHARITGQIAFAQAAGGHRKDAIRWVRKTIRHSPREARSYLALAVATRLVSADSVLRKLHKRGRGI